MASAGGGGGSVVTSCHRQDRCALASDGDCLQKRQMAFFLDAVAGRCGSDQGNNITLKHAATGQLVIIRNGVKWRFPGCRCCVAAASDQGNNITLKHACDWPAGDHRRGWQKVVRHYVELLFRPGLSPRVGGVVGVGGI
jgi:hypothetical protein